MHVEIILFVHLHFVTGQFEHIALALEHTQYVNHRTHSRGSITPTPPPPVTHIFTKKPTNQKPQHSASTCRAPTGKKRELVTVKPQYTSVTVNFTLYILQRVSVLSQSKKY